MCSKRKWPCIHYRATKLQSPLGRRVAAHQTQHTRQERKTKAKKRGGESLVCQGASRTCSIHVGPRFSSKGPVYSKLRRTAVYPAFNGWKTDTGWCDNGPSVSISEDKGTLGIAATRSIQSCTLVRPPSGKYDFGAHNYQTV